MNKGNVVSVIGGGGQIGTALTLGLLKSGFRVAVSDVAGFHDSLSAAEADFPKSLHTSITDFTNIDQARSHLIDVGDFFGEEPAGLIYLAHYKGGRVLDNSSDFFSPVENYPLPEWNKVLEVNLTGLLIATQILGKPMLEHGRGSIVTVSSTYGLVGPDQSIYGDSGINSPISYSVAKAGVVGFTKYLATSWGPRGVRTNCLVPGGVLNPRQTPEFQHEYATRTPLGRMASPEDYVGPVTLLLSEESSYMNGSVVVVDGGWTAI